MPILPEFHVWAKIRTTDTGERSLVLQWIDRLPAVRQGITVFFCGSFRIFVGWPDGQMPDQETLELLADPIIDYVRAQRERYEISAN